MPEGEIYIEKRRHKRVERTFPVAYKLMDGMNGEGQAGKKSKIEVESLNISITGIQLLCDEDLKNDAVVRMDVFLPEQPEPLATFSEVRWSAFDEKIGKYRIGLEFLVIKEDHIHAIKKITGEA